MVMLHDNGNILIGPDGGVALTPDCCCDNEPVAVCPTAGDHQFSGTAYLGPCTVNPFVILAGLVMSNGPSTGTFNHTTDTCWFPSTLELRATSTAFGGVPFCPFPPFTTGVFQLWKYRVFCAPNISPPTPQQNPNAVVNPSFIATGGPTMMAEMSIRVGPVLHLMFYFNESFSQFPCFPSGGWQFAWFEPQGPITLLSAGTFAISQ